MKWEHNPINYVYGGSVTGDIATAVGNATSAWSTYSDVDFSWGLYDVAVDASDFLDSNLTGYVHDLTDDGDCHLTGATVSFNSGDFNYFSQGEWNLVASHEFGHTFVLVHEPNSTYCSPTSIMLSAKVYMWNLTCQWEYLSSHDSSQVNLLY